MTRAIGNPKNRWPTGFSWKLACGFLALALSLVLYSVTCAPFVYWDDSAELAAAAAVLDVPHPSGYPLFTLLAHVAATLPDFGSTGPMADPAGRVNLLSALFGAVTAFFLYWVLILASGFAGGPAGPILPLLVATAFAASRTFWSVSTFAETYTLNAAIFLALLGIFLHALPVGPSRNHLYGFSFLLGLGLSNHPTIAAAAILPLGWPGSPWGGWKKQAHWVGAAGLFLAGLLPYLLLPIRGGLGLLPLSWEDPSSIRGFLAYLARSRYSTPLYTRPLGEMAALAWKGLSSMGGELALLAPLALLGFWWCLRRSRSTALALAAVFAADLAAAARFGPTGSEHKFSLYLVPCMVIGALFSLWGAAWLWRLAVSSPRGHWRRVGAPILCAGLVLSTVYLLVLNYPFNDRSTDRTALEYGRSILGALPPDAVLVTSLDNPLFLTAYLTAVEGYRPDVLVMPGETLARLGTGHDGRRVIRALARKEPAFGTLRWPGAAGPVGRLETLAGLGRPVVVNLGEDIQLGPSRLVPLTPFLFQVSPLPVDLTPENTAAYRDFWNRFDGDRLLRLPSSPLHPSRREVSRRLTQAAAYFLERGMTGEAGRLAGIALDLDPGNGLALSKRGLAAFLSGELGQAERDFNAASEREPRLAEAKANLGHLYLQTGRPSEAVKVLAEARRLDPLSPQILFNLARATSLAGRRTEALELLIELKAMAPHYPDLEKLEKDLRGP